MTAPHPETALRDSKTNLYEAAKAAIRDQEAKLDAERTARVSATGRRRRMGFMSVVGMAGAALLILQPVWLAGPKAIPAEPPPLAAATLRVTLVRERDRVFEFARRTGRLPATVAEAGVRTAGLTYDSREDGTFSLSGETSDSIITLSSTDSLSAFLGGSLRIIRDRGRP